MRGIGKRLVLRWQAPYPLPAAAALIPRYRRSDADLKRTVCKACCSLLIPGETCTVRVKRTAAGMFRLTTCRGCGAVQRRAARPGFSTATSRAKAAAAVAGGAADADAVAAAGGGEGKRPAAEGEGGARKSLKSQ